MGTLYLVGMGLMDENDMTRRAISLAASCGEIFMEAYSARHVDADPKAISKALGRPVKALSRKEMKDGKVILVAAEAGEAALLCGGDPGFSTNHAELVIRAKRQGIEVRWIHAPSLFPAAAALTGLSPYRFGRTVGIVPRSGEPLSTKPLERMGKNLMNGYHTLILLEPDMEREPPEHLLIPRALKIIGEMEEKEGLEMIGEDTLLCGIARPGSIEPVAVTGTMSKLEAVNWGEPLHTLVLPGKLGPLEAEGLVVLTGAPERILK